MAGRRGSRTPADRGGAGARRSLARPLRRGLQAAAALVVAAVTAVVVNYATARQDVVFDALDNVSGGAPLLVHPFRTDVSLLRRPWALPAPLPPERVPRRLDQQGFRDLVRSSSAVPIGSSTVEVTLEGNRNDSVIVENIAARIVSRSAAPNGTFISGPAFGGPEPKFVLGFDLDGADTRARIARGDGSLGDFFGAEEFLELAPGEKLVFVFQAVTEAPRLSRWVIDLTLQSGGRHTTLTLGEDSPYTVTGPVDDYQRYYQRGDWQITPSTAGQVCPGGCVAMADTWSRAHG